MPLVEQALPTIPGHLSSLLVFSGVRVTRSLVLYACFVDRCLPICFSIYGFLLPPFGIVKLFYFLSWSQEKNGACNKFLFQSAHFTYRKTIQENVINCKRQEVDDNILSIKVQMYIIYNFSLNFHQVIPEKDAIDSKRKIKKYMYHSRLNLDFIQK